ncbi:hypothetical protein EDD86DRAFT_211315 [Gorgonomyces haynaldii]|nr:hypothetical protein EDD86DRAFT_211315 [Gorgonomyces haynaldii]
MNCLPANETVCSFAHYVHTDLNQTAFNALIDSHQELLRIFEVMGCPMLNQTNLQSVIVPNVRYISTFSCQYQLQDTTCSPKISLCAPVCSAFQSSVLSLLNNTSYCLQEERYNRMRSRFVDRVTSVCSGSDCASGVPIEAQNCGFDSKDRAIDYCSNSNDICCNSYKKPLTVPTETPASNDQSGIGSSSLIAIVGVGILFLLAIVGLLLIRRRQVPQIKDSTQPEVQANRNTVLDEPPKLELDQRGFQMEISQ